MLVNYRFLLRSTIGGRAIGIVAVCLFVCLSCASKPERANPNICGPAPGPAKVDEMPSEEKRKVVWGEAISGLQAGMYLAEDTLRIGNTVTPIYYVRNTSARPIVFMMMVTSLRLPLILDSASRRVSVLFGPPSIRSDPVYYRKHILEPGGSIRLGLETCVLAARRPVYFNNKDGFSNIAFASTPPGQYQVGYEREVWLLKDENQPFSLFNDPEARRVGLHSGWSDLEVLLGDKDVLSKRVASELRRAAGRFNLKIVRMDEQDSPLRSLWLTVLEPKSRYPEFWSTVRISRQEAEAIIGHLEQTDYLWRTVAEPYDRKAFPIPSYFLSLSIGDESDPKQLFDLGPLPLGWGLEMDRRLKKLREMFVGESRKAMDELMTQLEPFRRNGELCSISTGGQHEHHTFTKTGSVEAIKTGANRR